MKNINFLSENFLFLEVKFSIYLNRHVCVMLLYHLVCLVKFSADDLLEYFLIFLETEWQTV